MNVLLHELRLDLILKPLVGPRHAARLMRGHVVEDGKEGLLGIRAIPPVRFGAVFSPRFGDQPVL